LVKGGSERHERTNGTIYFGCNPAGTSVGAPTSSAGATLMRARLGASAETIRSGGVGHGGHDQKDRTAPPWSSPNHQSGAAKGRRGSNLSVQWREKEGLESALPCRWRACRRRAGIHPAAESASPPWRQTAGPPKSNSSLETQMRWMITASLRATATVVRFMPRRWHATLAEAGSSTRAARLSKVRLFAQWRQAQPGR